MRLRLPEAESGSGRKHRGCNPTRLSPRSSALLEAESAASSGCRTHLLSDVHVRQRIGWIDALSRSREHVLLETERSWPNEVEATVVCSIRSKEFGAVGVQDTPAGWDKAIGKQDRRASSITKHGTATNLETQACCQLSNT